MEVRQTAEGALLVNVTLGNAGVAPFYYNLTLFVETELLAATGSRRTRSVTVGVPRILPGDTLQLLVTMQNVTAPTWTSLSSVTLSLGCSRCYADRPVPLANFGVNATMGCLKFSLGEDEFLFQPTQLPLVSDLSSSSASSASSTSIAGPAVLCLGMLLLVGKE